MNKGNWQNVLQNIKIYLLHQLSGDCWISVECIINSSERLRKWENLANINLYWLAHPNVFLISFSLFNGSSFIYIISNLDLSHQWKLGKLIACEILVLRYAGYEITIIIMTPLPVTKMTQNILLLIFVLQISAQEYMSYMHYT